MNELMDSQVYTATNSWFYSSLTIAETIVSHAESNLETIIATSVTYGCRATKSRIIAQTVGFAV